MQRIYITNSKGQQVDAVHAIGWRYCKEAAKVLGVDAPENSLLLREGAGKMLTQRLQKYGAEEVVRRLKVYMESQKFFKYPSLVTALDRDTYLNIERGTLK